MPCLELPSYMVPLQDGYQSKLRNNMILSEADDGWIKRRPRTTALIKEFTVQYIFCDKSNIKDFEAWYKNEINYGTQSFKVYDVQCDEFVRARLTAQDISYNPIDKYNREWGVTLIFERLY